MRWMYDDTIDHERSPSTISSSKSSLKRSRTTLTSRFGSSCSVCGPSKCGFDFFLSLFEFFFPEPFPEAACEPGRVRSSSAFSRIVSHTFCCRRTSRAMSSVSTPSAAVRMIAPPSSGKIPETAFFKRFRSGSGSLRDTPCARPSGTYTRYRPANEMWLVSRGPLCPTESFVT